MAFIKIFNFEESSGLLKKEYEKGMRRAGKIWKIETYGKHVSGVAGILEIFQTFFCGPTSGIDGGAGYAQDLHDDLTQGA